jgi:hypothetical protein
MAHACAIGGTCPCDGSVCTCAVTCPQCRTCAECFAAVPAQATREALETYATVLAGANVAKMAAALDRQSAALERLCDALEKRLA